MRIEFNQLVDGGPVDFSGELSVDEVTFLVQYALTDLIRKGLVPITATKNMDDILKYAPVSQETQ